MVVGIPGCAREWPATVHATAEREADAIRAIVDLKGVAVGREVDATLTAIYQAGSFPAFPPIARAGKLVVMMIASGTSTALARARIFRTEVTLLQAMKLDKPAPFARVEMAED